MRILTHYRFGKFAGRLRSLNKKRFLTVRDIQKRLSDSPAFSPCVLCEEETFELVSESDRFGLLFDKKICTNCGLMQTNPMPPKAFFNTFYERDYRLLYRGNREIDLPKILEIQRSRSRMFSEFIKQNCKLEDFHVFEIGCSYGGNLDTFADLGCSVSGCDLDPYAIRIAQQRHEATFVSELPQKSNTKPTIYILSHVLEHVPDPKSFLHKIHSLMTKFDLLFIEVPGIASLLNGAYRGDFLNYIHIGHVLEFNEKSLINTLSLSGFKTIASNEVCRGIFKKGKPTVELFENAYETTKNQILLIESRL